MGDGDSPTKSIPSLALEEDGLVPEAEFSEALNDDGDHIVFSLEFCPDGLGLGLLLLLLLLTLLTLLLEGDATVILLLLEGDMFISLLDGDKMESDMLPRRLRCVKPRFRLLLLLVICLLRVLFNSCWKNAELSESLNASSTSI